MGALRILMLVGALGFAAHWWKNHESVATSVAEPSPNGFEQVVMPDGVAANTVVILAPVNCPSDAAQRADALADALTRQGVRNIRSASYSANIANPTDAQNAAIKRAVAVMNGEIPAVFVNGMAKANPTADEVISEYERTR